MYPVLAAGPDGTIAFGWTEQPLADRSKAQLLVSVGTIGAALPAPSAVSPRAHDAVWPTAAVTARGDVIVAWTIGPSGSGAVRAAVYSR